MAQSSVEKIVVLHRNRPTISQLSVCEHFRSIDNLFKYYQTLGGITFINRTIVCEDCYEMILTGGWRDVSAATHTLDDESLRNIFSNLALLNTKINLD
jgi:hypothetical protein